MNSHSDFTVIVFMRYLTEQYLSGSSLCLRYFSVKTSKPNVERGFVIARVTCTQALQTAHGTGSQFEVVFSKEGD